MPRNSEREQVIDLFRRTGLWSHEQAHDLGVWANDYMESMLMIFCDQAPPQRDHIVISGYNDA